MAATSSSCNGPQDTRPGFRGRLEVTGVDSLQLRFLNVPISQSTSGASAGGRDRPG